MTIISKQPKQPKFRFHFVNPPLHWSDVGAAGDISFDEEFLYIYVNKKWKRTALSRLLPAEIPRSLPTHVPNGFISYVASRLYVFVKTKWTTVMTTPYSAGKHISRKSSRDMGMHDHILNARLVQPPINKYSFGQDGYVSYDQNYFYIFNQDQWFQRAIAIF